MDWDVGSLKEEQGDEWYHRGKKTKHALTEEERESRKAERETMKESWEIMGAFYALIFVSIFGSIYYYFCIRRKRLRNQNYEHVVPS